MTGNTVYLNLLSRGRAWLQQRGRTLWAANWPFTRDEIPWVSEKSLEAYLYISRKAINILLQFPTSLWVSEFLVCLFSKHPEQGQKSSKLKMKFVCVQSSVTPVECLLRSVQSLSRVRLFATPWTAACQASLSVTNSQSLFTLMPIESVMPSNHLILCCPLLLLLSIFPSIKVFSKESVLCIRWPKYWSFSFSMKSFQWIFRTDFL